MVNDDTHDSRTRKRAGCLQTAHRETLEWPVVAVSLSTTLAAVLVYSATGPLFSDDMYRFGPRLLLTGLCAAIAWPFWYSTTAMLLYVARHLTPALILGLCAVSVLFVAIPFVALGYAAVELFGLGSAAFPDIYLNAVAWVAACNAILLYTVCMRAKLRRRAEVVPSERPASEGPAESPPPTVSGGARRAGPPAVDPGEPRTEAARVTTEQHVRFLDPPPREAGAGRRLPQRQRPLRERRYEPRVRGDPDAIRGRRRRARRHGDAGAPLVLGGPRPHHRGLSA